MGRIVLAMMLAGLVGGVALAVDGEKSKAPERFDQLVRVDFFSGFNGDEAALARGLKKCDETLAKDPKHAEALVWRGTGGSSNRRNCLRTRRSRRDWSCGRPA